MTSDFLLHTFTRIQLAIKYVITKTIIDAIIADTVGVHRPTSFRNTDIVKHVLKTKTHLYMFIMISVFQGFCSRVFKQSA